MKFIRDEEAVSPVIGVILMVAITVILAAVIAAFVFGMAGNVSTTKSVAATAQQQGGDVILVTYQGGPDDSTLSYLTITAPNGTQLKTIAGGALGTVGQAGVKPAVGSSLRMAGPIGAFTGQDKVVVSATFTDGSTQVILDTNV